LRTYDGHLTVSERDAEQLRRVASGARVTVIENGVDINYYSEENLTRAHDVWRAAGHGERDAGETPPRRRVVFVGSMDYHANVDAVVHFAQQMWPEIRRRRPELVFTVVGRNPAPEVERLGALPGVEVTGTVPDVRPFYREAVAQIVPLRVGGGSRLKILEAMAARVPVISTTLGAEGLHVKHNVNILLADDAHAMSDALDALAADETLREGIIRGAGELVRKQYDWSALGAALSREHEFLLRQAGR
jgi:glycosyltransferase involved in cell wall biosynthesis